MINYLPYDEINNLTDKNIELFMHNPKKDNLFAVNDQGKIFDNIFNEIIQECAEKELFNNYLIKNQDETYSIQTKIIENNINSTNKEFNGYQIIVLSLYKTGEGPIQTIELKRAKEFTKIVNLNNLYSNKNIISEEHPLLPLNIIITNFLLKFL